MNHEGEALGDRLDRHDREIQEVRSRLQVIESRLGMAHRVEPVVAPPVWSESVQGPRTEETPWTPPFLQPEPFDTRPAPAFEIESPSKPTADAELQFGSVVLPRVGAGVVLLGIGYLVALGINEGWINAVTQFWGAVALCIGSIAIGFWKRQEKFEFGQVLIGLGSCGLYVTFACGHAFQNLLDGETLVFLYLGLSLVNLLYGGVTPSKTFTGIGLIGGLIAATLPMDRGASATSLILHAAIVLPTAAILARHKWREMAMGAWVISTVALLWPTLEPGPWVGQLVLLYGASLLLLLAYAWSHAEWEFDPNAAFVPFAAMATGLLAWVVSSRVDPGATYHEVFFGIALIGSSMLIRSEASRRALLLAGVLVPFVIAPQGLESLNDAWIYLILGALAALASLKFAPKAATSLAALGFGLAFLMYGRRLFDSSIPLGLAEETMYLLAASALTILTAWTSSRWFRDIERLTLGAFVVLTPILGRLSVVQLGQPGIEASGFASVAAAMLALSTLGALVSLAKKWPNFAGYGWTVFGVALLSYLFTFERTPLSVGAETAVLLGSLVAIVMNGVATGRASSSRDVEPYVLLGAVLISPVVSRLTALLIGDPNVESSVPITVAGTLLALAAAGAILSMRRGWLLLAGFAWTAFAAACIAYAGAVIEHGGVGVSIDGSVLASMLAVIVLSGMASGRSAKAVDATCVVSGILGWGVFTRLFYVVATQPGGMSGSAAVTMAWILYAVALIVVGFVMELRVLRLTSLCVFGTTLGKVLLYDLSEVPPGIRVVLLILLGLTMIGGGYWYVRRNETGGNPPVVA